MDCPFFLTVPDRFGLFNTFSQEEQVDKMAAITAGMVAELRAKTDAPMMELTNSDPNSFFTAELAPCRSRELATVKSAQSNRSR